MRQADTNRHLRSLDEDYFKYNKVIHLTYVVYKKHIYKGIKYNEAITVVLDVDTNILYFMSWGLFFTILRYETLEEARNAREIYETVYNTNNLYINYGSNDIYTYDFKENLKMLKINKTNERHYKAAGVNVQLIKLISI